MIKYTSGNELYDSTGQSYVGYYFEDEFGKPHAGQNKSNKEFRLLNRQELDRSRYRFNTKKAFVQSDRPLLYKPILDEEDYLVGKFARYFVQKRTNLANILEISEDQYNSYGNSNGINSNLWKVSFINWTIVGSINHIMISNYVELGKLEKEFPLIKSYFKNLTQYGRFSDQPM